MRYAFSFLLCLVYLNTFGQSVSYNSKLTEYTFLQSKMITPLEWIDRDIKISNDKITIISRGKLATEIQTWLINYQETNYDTFESTTVYYTHSPKAEYDYEDPSLFIVYKNKEGKVEIIDWQIPPLSESESTEPRTTRFYID